MERIIAGRFSTKADADSAAQPILAYIDDHDVCIFHNNPPGQHGTSLFGEDGVPETAAHHHSSTYQHADKHADKRADRETVAEAASVTTAVMAGVVAGAVALTVAPLVPILALAAAGIGSYGGSLAGALDGMSNVGSSVTHHEHHGPLNEPSERKGGVILAVRIAHLANQVRVIRDLDAANAADIEQADGEWSDGDWIDFNPRAVPHLIHVDVANHQSRTLL